MFPRFNVFAVSSMDTTQAVVHLKAVRIGSLMPWSIPLIPLMSQKTRLGVTIGPGESYGIGQNQKKRKVT